MKEFLGIFLLITLTSCGKLLHKKTVVEVFEIPIIKQEASTDTIEYFNENYISHSYPSFAGKSKFIDTLSLPIRRNRDTSYFHDFLFESQIWRQDSLFVDGFEIYPDYKSTVSRIDYDLTTGNYYYPVYMVNQTPLTKLFIGKDGHIFGIQEALDTNGVWRPIEGRGFDFCGNGYWGVKVHPNEFITMLFPKYKGNYKTKLRVRIKNGDNLYVSKPYDGLINKKQFILNKDRDYHYRELVEHKASAIQHLFYGAEPMEVADKSFGLHVVWSQ